jgi:hypothetical protein
MMPSRTASFAPTGAAHAGARRPAASAPAPAAQAVFTKKERRLIFFMGSKRHSRRANQHTRPPPGSSPETAARPDSPKKFFHRSRAWRRDALVAFIARPERTAIYNNEKPHTPRPLNSPLPAREIFHAQAD